MILSSPLVIAAKAPNANNMDTGEQSRCMATGALDQSATMVTDPVALKELADFILANHWIWDGHVIKFFSEEWWRRIPLEVTSIVLNPLLAVIGLL